MRSRSPADRGGPAPWPGRSAHDRGSVTAEFAAVVPAVILLLACCLGCVQVVAQQVQLQDAAAQVARSLARGGSTGAAARVSASVGVSQNGDLLCATLGSAARAPVVALLGVSLTATSCALAGGK